MSTLGLALLLLLINKAEAKAKFRGGSIGRSSSTYGGDDNEDDDNTFIWIMVATGIFVFICVILPLILKCYLKQESIKAEKANSAPTGVAEQAKYVYAQVFAQLKDNALLPPTTTSESEAPFPCPANGTYELIFEVNQNPVKTLVSMQFMEVENNSTMPPGWEIRGEDKTGVIFEGFVNTCGKCYWIRRSKNLIMQTVTGGTMFVDQETGDFGFRGMYTTDRGQTGEYRSLQLVKEDKLPE